MQFAPDISANISDQSPSNSTLSRTNKRSSNQIPSLPTHSNPIRILTLGNIILLILGKTSDGRNERCRRRSLGGRGLSRLSDYTLLCRCPLSIFERKKLLEIAIRRPHQSAHERENRHYSQTHRNPAQIILIYMCKIYCS